jgi:hypothetical protein
MITELILMLAEEQTAPQGLMSEPIYSLWDSDELCLKIFFNHTSYFAVPDSFWIVCKNTVGEKAH